MRRVLLNLPMFGLAAATRAALGAGVGLLLADRLDKERRKRVGAGLIALGAATTVVVARALMRGAHEAEALELS